MAAAAGGAGDDLYTKLMQKNMDLQLDKIRKESEEKENLLKQDISRLNVIVETKDKDIDGLRK